MNFENLQLFRDIAANKSISKAADLHGVTPSAASQMLNELERTFGVQLLDRSTRPLCLTPGGKLYSDFCRDVLRRYEQFEASLGDLRQGVDGIVRVAAIYSVGLSEMSDLESQFRRQYPEADIDVDYLRPEKVYDAVLADRADLGLVSYPEASKELTVLPWRDEEMVVAAIPSHPLMRLKAVEPKDLDGVDFITFDDDLPIGRELSRYLRSHGVQPSKTLRFDNLNTVKEAVLLGNGVSIVPARVLKAELADGRVSCVPLAAPGLYRPLGIIHRKKKRFHRAAQALLDLLQHVPDTVELVS